MLNSFLGIDTVTRGLLLQQLEQNVIASNLANPSTDAQGYLMNSLEQVNSATGIPLSFTGPNGVLQVESGPNALTITRLRNSFLDTQIQQESSVLGKAEILNNYLPQINSIINSSATTTLNYALTQFAQAWATLGGPTNTSAATDAADRAAVVSTGTAFAQMSQQQFNQLQNLQVQMNSQINGTVGQINGYLQQISSINNQLSSTQGSNQNALLDARDYALDKLSRLINIQATFGTAGVVNVYLGGSGLSLVNSAGASLLQTNITNPHNPNLVSVTLQSAEGSPYGPNTPYQSTTTINKGGPLNPGALTIGAQSANFKVAPTSGSFTINGVTVAYTTGDTLNQIMARINSTVPGVVASFNAASQQVNIVAVEGGPAPVIKDIGGGNFTKWAFLGQVVPIAQDLTPLITGGNLGGELQARDVTLESYKDQIDQITTAVMNITNSFHSAGFAADGSTTGTLFFSGTGARDITVNGGIVSNNALVAESSVATNVALYPGAPAAPDKLIAQFLGNLPNLLANNFAGSLSTAGSAVDPYLFLDNPSNVFATTVAGSGPGSFTLDGVTVSYNSATDSIYTILQKMNAVAGIQAVYDSTNFRFYIFSANPVNIVNVSGNPPFTSWTNITNVLASTLMMNNEFAPTQPKIAINSPLDSVFASTVPPPAGGPNVTAFQVSPSTQGSFVVNGIPVFYPSVLSPTQKPWVNTQTLNSIAGAIKPATLNAVSGQALSNMSLDLPTFFGGNPVAGFILASSQPIQVADTSGNFTVFTGLNANMPLNALGGQVLTQITSDVSAQQALTDQASNSLTQLNNAQANIAGVDTSTKGTGPGVPIATLQEQAAQSLIVYNALLQLMEVMDQMFSDLISAVGGGGTSSSTITFQTK